MRDLTRYSARSCLGVVDLKLTDASSSDRYTFADPACQEKLLAVLHTLAGPAGNHETSAEAEMRRQAAEDARAEADEEAAEPARVLAARAPGKRVAMAALLK